MTETGTFIINGTERVIVSQLHRSPGRLLHPRDADLAAREGGAVPRVVDRVRVRQEAGPLRAHRPQAAVPRDGLPAGAGARVQRPAPRGLLQPLHRQDRDRRRHPDARRPDPRGRGRAHGRAGRAARRRPRAVCRSEARRRPAQVAQGPRPDEGQGEPRGAWWTPWSPRTSSTPGPERSSPRPPRRSRPSCWPGPARSGARSSSWPSRAGTSSARSSRRPSRRTPSAASSTRSWRSTAACGRAIHRPRSPPPRSSTASSSTRASTTSPRSGASSSTSSWA